MCAVKNLKDGTIHLRSGHRETTQSKREFEFSLGTHKKYIQRDNPKEGRPSRGTSCGGPGKELQPRAKSNPVRGPVSYP
jgi:hypothetical protein